MEQVIFHPYWGVPESIKTKELLPSLANGNIGVLERQNLRVSYRGRDINPATVDWTKADMRKFHVYQPPGSSNVLGIVKFRFPNKHDVYMHDTPSKSLFNASTAGVQPRLHARTRSPEAGRTGTGRGPGLAGGPRRGRGPARSQGQSDQPDHARCRVHMTYFTAWVDDDGKVKTFADIYGHESRIALGISRQGAHDPAGAENAAPDRPGEAARIAAPNGVHQRAQRRPGLDAPRIPVLRRPSVPVGKALLRHVFLTRSCAVRRDVAA